MAKKTKLPKLSPAQHYALQVMANYRHAPNPWPTYDQLTSDWKITGNTLFALLRKGLLLLRTVRTHVEYFEHQPWFSGGHKTGETYRYHREYRLTPAGQRYLDEYDKINHTTYAETNRNF